MSLFNFSCIIALFPLGLVSVSMVQAEPSPVLDASPASDHPQSILVIPGGGLDGIRPAPWTIARCKAAADMYHRLRSEGNGSQSGGATAKTKPPVHIVTLSLGTPHKPIPVDPKNEFQVSEAEAAARWLVEEGEVEPDHILEEAASLDTIGNAYWFRLVHLEPLIERYGRARVTVFTTRFHFPRTKLIFEHMLSIPRTTDSAQQARPLDVPSDLERFYDDRAELSIPLLTQIPAESSTSGDSGSGSDSHKAGQSLGGLIDLSFVATADVGMTPEVLQSRRERELTSLRKYWGSTYREVRTLAQAHAFVFGAHKAYASQRLKDEKPKINASALKTY